MLFYVAIFYLFIRLSFFISFLMYFLPLALVFFSQAKLNFDLLSSAVQHSLCSEFYSVNQQQVHTGFTSLMISAVITNVWMSPGDMNPVQTHSERGFASQQNSHHAEGMTEQTHVLQSWVNLPRRLHQERANNLRTKPSPSKTPHAPTYREKRGGWLCSEESRGRHRCVACCF